MTEEELPTPTDDTVTDIGEYPVLASYDVIVTFRGTKNIVPPTISEIEEIIENRLVDFGGPGGVAVRASASRRDK